MRARLRHPNNLGEELREILNEHHPSLGERFKALYLDQITPTLETYPVEVQMRALNEYWRVQLGLVDGDTVTARCGLVEGVPPEVWVGNFRKYVMPAVRQYGVPMQPTFQVQLEPARWMRYMQ